MTSPTNACKPGKALGILFLVFLYFVSPIDIIPDFILGLGQVDDLGIIIYGVTSAYNAWTGKPSAGGKHLA